MEYYDEQILEARWEEERRKHTTLETGIYVEDDLITFSQITLPDTKIRLYLPDQFVVMPDQVREVKYPSLNAPDFIITSLDSTVNFGFNILPVELEEGDTKTMSRQFQNALRNVNPSIYISERVDNTAADNVQIVNRGKTYIVLEPVEMISSNQYTVSSFRLRRDT